MSLSSPKTPAGYKFRDQLDFNQPSVKTITGAAGVVLFFAFGWIFVQIGMVLRSDFAALLASKDFNLSMIPLMLMLIILLVITVLMAFFHEAIHGFFYWLYSRQKPLFGLNLPYAWSAIPPDVYLHRNQYIVAALAPLVIISLAGILLIQHVPLWMIPPLIAFLTFNAASAISDLYLAGWLLRKPANALISDEGLVSNLFTPNPLSIAR